eukprot:6193105-Pleurochrysis_carterae.AAC.2
MTPALVRKGFAAAAKLVVIGLTSALIRFEIGASRGRVSLESCAEQRQKDTRASPFRRAAKIATNISIKSGNDALWDMHMV